MKLLIDLQGCQAASRTRGIGRYSLALAKAIVRNRGKHKIILLANGAFQEGLIQLRSAFAPAIPDEDFIVFDADFPVAELNPDRSAQCRLAEAEREQLITTLSPDAVLITSLFEGFLDDAVTSIGRTGEHPLTAVVLYDLIPYFRPDPNWPPEYPPFYDRKIESLKCADLLLSISEYSKTEASETIPELGDRITNISSACDEQFTPGIVESSRRSALFHRLGIRDSFFMSSGNIEPRKNFELILFAFAQLPQEERQKRQIVLVGSTGDSWMTKRLHDIAAELGLEDEQLIITDHLEDQDLLDLYRLCELFIFPSKHEGFGLPPLEAMSCGAAVLGSRATSVPEVIGRADALFDPESVDELSDLMLKVIRDKDFLSSLKATGLKRATEFSWDLTAQAAIKAMENGIIQRAADDLTEAGIASMSAKRSKLAMVTPLPPEQTGIADYVTKLLPELGKYYEITIISDQSEASHGPNGEVFDTKSIEWFESNSTEFNRIIYQIGNSPFHVHMLDLINRHPGVVVLHDFFISALTAWMETSGYEPEAFKRVLLHSHGYAALNDLEKQGRQATILKWPCSFSAVQAAKKLIVHSRHSSDLISRFYGEKFAKNLVKINLQQLLPSKIDRNGARARLNIPTDQFIVCAFGFMDRTKKNIELIESWARSKLASSHNCKLIFVGGHSEPVYGQEINDQIASIEIQNPIEITGFLSKEKFEDYLNAADMAVQLRTMSRGETSGTVLDCMAHGLPVVINAHGSMQEIPDDVLIKLKDDFDTAELTSALEQLYSAPTNRQTLGKRAQEYIAANHTPEKTARAYVEAIEQVVKSTSDQRSVRATRLLWQSVSPQSRHDRAILAQKLNNLATTQRRPTLYLDISATAHNDLKSGIERVARSLLREILLNPPVGYHVAPAYLTEEKGHWRVRTANQYLSQQEGFALAPQQDEIVIPGAGDILLALDLYADGVVPAAQQGLYNYWHHAGAKVGFVVFDILPITHPQYFPSWAPDIHEAWTRTVTRNADFLTCISQHVQTELARWMDLTGVHKDTRPKLEVSYLGADVDASLPTRGLPEGAESILKELEQRPTFLMVGTIEPRKGHLQTLEAFHALWETKYDANLVIVGSEGWKPLPDEERRTIPTILRTIRDSAELGQRLFWLEGISDEYLEKVYAHADYLVAASEEEGFGLPIIEAKRHGLQVLARDIPVFREVGGDSITYFPGSAMDGLRETIRSLLTGSAPTPNPQTPGDDTWLTWKESAENLVRIAINQNPEPPTSPDAM